MPHKVLLSASKFDKALFKEATANYKLSIQLSLDGFSFCILDAERNKYLGIEVYSFKDVITPLVLNNILNELIPKTDWLNLSYNKISIIYECPKSTLIPNPLFDVHHMADYLWLNHYQDFGEKILYDRLTNLGAVNIYAMPDIIIHTLQHFFPGARIHHFASPLVENLLILNKNRDEGFKIFTSVRKAWFDIVVLNGKNLIFINSFKYNAEEDFVYFLIYVMDQLNLNPEKTELTLFGEITKISALFELTFKYVRNVNFGKRIQDYEYSYVLDEIPEHFYFNLFNLHHCEL